MDEIWKPIGDYIEEISNHGRIRRGADIKEPSKNQKVIRISLFLERENVKTSIYIVWLPKHFYQIH